MSAARGAWMLLAAALLGGVSGCGGGSGPSPFAVDPPAGPNVLSLKYSGKESSDTVVAMDVSLVDPEPGMSFAGGAVAITVDLTHDSADLTFAGFTPDPARVGDAVATADPDNAMRVILALAGVSPGHLGTLRFDTAVKDVEATFGLESAAFMGASGVILPHRVIDARGGHLKR